MEIFIPGRLLIIGDHSDWVGTFNRGIDTECIEVLLQKGIYADVEKSDKFEFFYKNQLYSSELSKEELEKTACNNSFFRYVAGTALQLYQYGGLKITITKMDLPIAKGLASSASICALVAQAYNKLYDLKFSPAEIMRIAFLGETITGSKCGRGDQIGAYSESPNKVFKLIFNNETVSVTPVNLKSKFYFLIADVKGDKNTGIICRDLQNAFLTNSEVSDFLEKDNTMLCENCKTALEEGNLEKLGYYMRLGLELFDKKMAPHSYEQLKSPKLHAIVDDEFIKKYSKAAKGTGAQGDGSVQILCNNYFSMIKIKKYLKKKYTLESEVLILKP